MSKKSDLTPRDRQWLDEVLQMFADLQRSYDPLDDKSGIDTKSIEFEGFDGNLDEGRFNLYTGGINTHWPMSAKYRSMLLQYRSAKEKSRLTREEILRITNAKTP